MRKIDKALKHKAKVMSFLLLRPDSYELFFPPDTDEKLVAITKGIALASMKNKFLSIKQYEILEVAYHFNEQERRAKGLSNMEDIWQDYLRYKRRMVA